MELEDPWATLPEETKERAESQDTRDSPEQQAAASCWKRAAMWMCGLSGHAEAQLSAEEQQALERKLTNIEEIPMWRNVCNINALILLTINVFLWGFFA